MIISFGQNKRYKKCPLFLKNAPFFFCELQLIAVLLLIRSSYMS